MRSEEGCATLRSQPCLKTKRCWTKQAVILFITWITSYYILLLVLPHLLTVMSRLRCRRQRAILRTPFPLTVWHTLKVQSLLTIVNLLYIF